MKKNAFTLIELLSVIIILGLTVTLVVVRVEKNIKDTKKLANAMQIKMIEDAALLMSTDYQDELTKLNSKNIETITLQTLVNKGLLKSSDLKGIPLSNKVLLAKINDDIRVNYDKLQSNKNVIFLTGLDNITLHKNDTYTESGAYVAIIDTGVVALTSSNISGTINTNTVGTYKKTYSYNNAVSVTRTINIIE
jgi:prepilin-type N-terminal cleavage/methylation domain-containing protein